MRDTKMVTRASAHCVLNVNTNEILTGLPRVAPYSATAGSSAGQLGRSLSASHRAQACAQAINRHVSDSWLDLGEVFGSSNFDFVRLSLILSVIAPEANPVVPRVSQKAIVSRYHTGLIDCDKQENPCSSRFIHMKMHSCDMLTAVWQTKLQILGQQFYMTARCIHNDMNNEMCSS